jgi:hypothetical protein
MLSSERITLFKTAAVSSCLTLPMRQGPARSHQRQATTSINPELESCALCPEGTAMRTRG